MATIAPEQIAHRSNDSPWAGFKSGLWQKEINVRDFIQQNYKPYEGDDLSWLLRQNGPKNMGSIE